MRPLRYLEMQTLCSLPLQADPAWPDDFAPLVCYPKLKLASFAAVFRNDLEVQFSAKRRAALSLTSRSTWWEKPMNYSPEFLEAIRKILNETRQDRMCRPFLAKR